MKDRVSFEVAGAKTYPDRDFDLVAFFDCLHDTRDPVGAACHVRESLATGSGLTSTDAKSSLHQQG